MADLHVVLNALYRWIPDELVQLQSETYGKVIREYPLSELLWVKKAVGAVPGASRVFAERG